MSIEDDILVLATEMEALLARFKTSSTDGKFLSTEDQEKFKRLALEAKAAVDTALGVANDFSINLLSSINAGSGGFFGGPSYSVVSEAAQILRGAVNQYRRRRLSSSTPTNSQKPPYVDLSRIEALRVLKNTQWDYARLVQMCIEINVCLLYTSPSPRDRTRSRMPSSA